MPVVVASSAGGPEALRLFFSSLPPNLPIGGVIVQHMAAGFTRLLGENLNQISSYWIREAEDGDLISQGQFLVAPGGYHLSFTVHGVVQLLDAPRVNSVKPAADITLSNLAPLYRRRLTAVVLSGLGQDGLDGSRAVRAHGGVVLAQNRESSVAYFMPKAVVEANLAQDTGSPAELSHKVASLSQRRTLTMPIKPTPMVSFPLPLPNEAFGSAKLSK